MMQPDQKLSSELSVLLIDDSITTCELVGEYLSEQLFRKIDYALTVQEAKKLLSLKDKNLYQPNYELIILDIHLPDFSGVDLCRMIRRHRAYKDVPILMITADQSLAVLENSFSAGATDYILKPFSKIELLVRLNAALKSYQQQLQLKQLAHYDPLTGLTNRMLFLDRVNNSIERSLREHHQFAVMFIDLNDFKVLNDTYGHALGDKALIHLAKILKQSSRSVDTVGRYAGDEFVVLIENINSEEEVNIVIERIYEGLKQPIDVADESIQLSISIGVATYPRDGKSTKALLEVADQKMYENKEAYKKLSRFTS